MKKFPESLSKLIDHRKKVNAFRFLMESEGLVDFYSNDYLGVAQLVFESDALSGSTGSRLISGNSDETIALETELAQFFKHQAALLFNSGYDANLGVFSSIALKGDTVIYDNLVHASIRDGVRMSLANSFPFKHNDLKQLEAKIKRAKGTIYVAVESVYSMDGDQAPLIEIAAICEANGAYLIVDEAHSGGLYGENGVGLVTKLGLDSLVFAKVITFGKAYGSHGAVVLGSTDLKDYLINFARSLIYTTTLPPHAQARIKYVVNTVAAMGAERNRLERNITLFRSIIHDGSLELMPSDSAIQCIVIPGNEAVKAKAEQIRNGGFAVKAILSPTVPEGRERIRICIHSFNSEEEIKSLGQLING